MEDSLHDGHRQRMRKRTYTDLEGLHEHEVLEMLLFYALPRVNTNPIAHRLIAEFGSLTGVLSASQEELLSINGVGQHTAKMLAFIKGFCNYMTQAEQVGRSLRVSKEVCSFFSLLYRFEQSEVVRLAMLDSRLRLIRCVRLVEGDPLTVSFLPRYVTQRAYAAQSNTVILAHNHPHGSSEPSPEDISATRILASALRQCNIELIDHVIVGIDGVTSMRESGGFILN